MKPVEPWVTEARVHWRKYRPTMYRQLERSGKLTERLEKAARRAHNECIASIQAGMTPWEAESEAKKNHLFLPAEEDMPEIGADPNRLPDPASLITTPGVNRRKQSEKRSRTQDGLRPNQVSREQFQKRPYLTIHRRRTQAFCRQHSQHSHALCVRPGGFAVPLRGAGSVAFRDAVARCAGRAIALVQRYWVACEPWPSTVF